MGEVYKATDINLKRAVAIKVLPASVAADADRLTRFQRETEVLAALNHPNIAAIYGLERSGAAIALVMELVDGPTLADRIARGAISAAEESKLGHHRGEGIRPNGLNINGSNKNGLFSSLSQTPSRADYRWRPAHHSQSSPFGH
jgi:serine/threonine protein kinase